MFDNADLPEVTEEFNRYTAVEFSIRDPQLRELKLSGSFNATELTSLLENLEAGFSVRAVLSGNRIDLYTQEKVAAR